MTWSEMHLRKKTGILPMTRCSFRVEKVEQYRQYIQAVIKRHSSHRPVYGEVELQTIFDTEHDHYQLVYAGWHKNHRKYGCLMHFDIKDGKIWTHIIRGDSDRASHSRGVETEQKQSG